MDSITALNNSTVSLGQWRNRPAGTSTYAPWWTDPDWDGVTEYSCDGRQERKFVDDPFTTVRPAILPRDAGRRPTEHAVRFGIYPAAPNDSVGYSQMTPVSESSSRVPPAGSGLTQNPRDVELDESYQRMRTKGFTTQDVRGLECVGCPPAYLP